MGREKCAYNTRYIFIKQNTKDQRKGIKGILIIPTTWKIPWAENKNKGPVYQIEIEQE